MHEPIYYVHVQRTERGGPLAFLFHSTCRRTPGRTRPASADVVNGRLCNHRSATCGCGFNSRAEAFQAGSKALERCEQAAQAHADKLAQDAIAKAGSPA
jgi:hypothetical protein